MKLVWNIMKIALIYLLVETCWGAQLSHYIPPTQDFKAISQYIPPTKEVQVVSQYIPPTKEVQVVSEYIPPTKEVEVVSEYRPPTKQVQVVSEYRPPTKQVQVVSEYRPPTKQVQRVSGKHSSSISSSGFSGQSAGHYFRGGGGSGRISSGSGSGTTSSFGRGSGRTSSFGRGSEKTSSFGRGSERTSSFGRGSERTSSLRCGTGGTPSFESRSVGVPSHPVVDILRDEREGPVDGFYSLAYETEDGIVRAESGSPSGPNGAVAQQGSWSFTFPDGTPAQFNFVADENGFQVDSDLIPKPHPLPDHAVAQIEKAERERAAGITHGGQYTEDDHHGGSIAHQGRSTPTFGVSSSSFQGHSSFSGRDPQAGSYSGGVSSGFGDASSQAHGSSFGSGRGTSFQTSRQRDSFGRKDGSGFGTTSQLISERGRKTTGVSSYGGQGFKSRAATGHGRLQTSQMSYRKY